MLTAPFSSSSPPSFDRAARTPATEPDRRIYKVSPLRAAAGTSDPLLAEVEQRYAPLAGAELAVGLEVRHFAAGSTAMAEPRMLPSPAPFCVCAGAPRWLPSSVTS